MNRLVVEWHEKSLILVITGIFDLLGGGIPIANFDDAGMSFFTVTELVYENYRWHEPTRFRKSS